MLLPLDLVRYTQAERRVNVTQRRVKFQSGMDRLRADMPIRRSMDDRRAAPKNPPNIGTITVKVKVKHVCGLQGFDGMKDVCEPCTERGERRKGSRRLKQTGGETRRRDMGRRSDEPLRRGYYDSRVGTPNRRVIPFTSAQSYDRNGFIDKLMRRTIDNQGRRAGDVIAPERRVAALPRRQVHYTFGSGGAPWRTRGDDGRYGDTGRRSGD